MEITGRVTKDAEVRNTNGGRQVVAFTTVVNDTYKTKAGEKKQVATFFNCSYWVSTAVAAALTKGSIVHLTGRVDINSYQKRDGDFMAGLVFHTNSIKIIAKGGNAAKATAEPKAPGTTKEDLPF